MQQSATIPTSAIFWRAAPFIFVVLWSGGFGFAKLGLNHVEPFTMLVLRYGLAVAVLAPVVVIRRLQWPCGIRHWASITLTGFLIQGVYFGLAYLAMKRGMNAGTTAIIMSLQPALVATLSPWFGGRKGSPLLWLGLAIGMAGVVLAIWSEGTLGPSPWGGSILALGALLGISAATLFEKWHGFKTDPVASGLIQYLVGFVLLAPVAAVTESLAIDWHSELVVALAYLVLANSLISIGLYLALIQRGDATRISSFMYLVPPLAMVLAWALLGESVHPLALAGLALSAFGVYVVSYQTR